MRSARLILIGSLLVAALVALAALYLIPQPVSWQGGTLLFRLPLILTCVYAIFLSGAGVLFLTTLDVYKAGLRRAYVAIATGIMLLGLATVQVPFINAFGWWHTAWAVQGGIVLPFVVSAIITYVGVRAFARLMSIRTWPTRPVVVVPLLIVSCVLSVFFPHVAVATPEMVFDISNAIIMLLMMFYIVSALTSWQILRSVGTHYTQAMTWLVCGLSGSAFVLVIAIFHTLLVGPEQDTIALVTGGLGLLVGAMFLIAGYSFAKTREY